MRLNCQGHAQLFEHDRRRIFMTSANLEKLYEGISSGDYSAIRSVLERMPSLVNSKDSTPPPIHWAIYQNDFEAFKTLLDFDPDLELKDQDRDATPLDYAIVFARLEMVRALIDKGADSSGRLVTARKGEEGGFGEFEDTPSVEEYSEIVLLLEGIGATD